MSASKVLDLAVEQGLLEAKVIAELRKQIAESKFVVTPEAIAKILVDHGHLTPFQARKLVSSALGPSDAAAAPSAPPTIAKNPPLAAAKSSPAVVSKKQDLPDEFSLADDDGNAIAPAPAPPPAEDIIDLEPVEPAPQLKPLAPARQSTPPKPSAPKSTPTPAARGKPAPPPAPAEEEVIDLEPVPPSKRATAPSPRPPSLPSRPKPEPSAPATVVDELVPLTPLPARSPSPVPRPPTPAPASLPLPSAATALATAPAPAATLKPIDDLFGDPMGASADPLANSALLGTAPPPADAKKKKAIKNVWDSPFLLIGGGGVGVLTIAILLLFYSLTRGSAAELFNKAEQEYTATSYASAIKYYESYLESYPNGPEASMGRVRVAMAQLHQVSDGGQNPKQSLQVAKEILPKIETEEKFGDARIELSDHRERGAIRRSPRRAGHHSARHRRRICSGGQQSGDDRTERRVGQARQ